MFTISPVWQMRKARVRGFPCVSRSRLTCNYSIRILKIAQWAKALALQALRLLSHSALPLTWQLRDYVGAGQLSFKDLVDSVQTQIVSLVSLSRGDRLPRAFRSSSPVQWMWILALPRRNEQSLAHSRCLVGAAGTDSHPCGSHREATRPGTRSASSISQRGQSTASPTMPRGCWPSFGV